MPEWGEKVYDLALAYHGNSAIKIEKKLFKDYQNIITEGCMDLAQRYGQLKQINPNICTYNYIHKKLGLIIENINN